MGGMEACYHPPTPRPPHSTAGGRKTSKAPIQSQRTVSLDTFDLPRITPHLSLPVAPPAHAMRLGVSRPPPPGISPPGFPFLPTDHLNHPNPRRWSNPCPSIWAQGGSFEQSWVQPTSGPPRLVCSGTLSPFIPRSDPPGSCWAAVFIVVSRGPPLRSAGRRAACLRDVVHPAICTRGCGGPQGLPRTSARRNAGRAKVGGCRACRARAGAR